MLSISGPRAGAVATPPVTLTVDVGRPGVALSPMLYGLMTEEINHAYDGGLSAELIRNRTFQDDPAGPVSWSPFPAGEGSAKIALDRADPVSASLPISLRMELTGGHAAVANGGFWGIPVKPDTRYAVSFYAKAGGDFSGPVRAAIVSTDGHTTYAQADTATVGRTWSKYALVLTTGHGLRPTADARFVLSADGRGSVDFSLVSVFPPTYMDQPNGLRPDLVELMAAMRPAFIRLPGGNYLEGNKFAERFDWKHQIGPLEDRPGHMGCWGYRSSDGFGLPQYLTWCNDLHAEPVLAVFAGYTLNGDHLDAGPLLRPFVDEALDEIEYVTGGPDTVWGKQRIADGHAAPFKLHYVEVGNEDNFDKSGSYDGRFAQFYDAIKARHPDLQVIATMPVKSRRPDVIDDHYYRSPMAMARDDHHYDQTDRNGPKIFVGEWASQDGKPTPSLKAALGDAAWLIGLERDSDIVPMSCYAPLLVNVNKGAAEWGTNLIGYDALDSFGSPSYYAQTMLAQNKGDVTLPVDVSAAAADASTHDPAPHGGVGVATWQTAAEFKDLSVTTKDGQKHTIATDVASPAWHVAGGHWAGRNGVVAQDDVESNGIAFTGDPAWTDYAFHAKAQKTDGREGFIVVVHAADERNFVWWNVGGWDNTRTGLEVSRDGDRVAFGPSSDRAVETGKWYDLRVEVTGRHVKCFLDDQLVNEADVPAESPNRLFAGATFDKANGDVLLKIVNLSDDAVDLSIKLKGVATVSGTGKVTVLTGASLSDVNSLAEPRKVAPQEDAFAGAAASFARQAPAPIVFHPARTRHAVARAA